MRWWQVSTAEERERGHSPRRLGIPYEQPLPRPRLRALLAAGLVMLALFALADRPASSAVGGSHDDYVLVPARTAPAVPTITLTCPADATGAWVTYDVTFGYALESHDPVARVDVDYGDGHTSSGPTTDGVFAHRYMSSGAFTVTATITTTDGLAATATCTWRLSMAGA